MRVLNEHELLWVGAAGADTYRVNLPWGATWTSKLEENKSTTITIRSAGFKFNWNSGEFITSTALSTGVGLMVSAFSGGNVPLGMLVDGAVAAGRAFAFSHTDEDGDEFF